MVLVHLMHLHGATKNKNKENRMVVVTLPVCWTLMTLLLMTMTTKSAETSLSCETARMKCAYRTGCGMALQNYMVGCSDVMSGRIRRCPDLCKKALIALTSTDEGQELMRCECGGQEFCEASKRRVEVCRPDVMRANAEHSIVSCSVAQWICAADPLCSTALEYYRRLCRSMFHGKKCTPRCNNSISILNRQEKAAKLRTCECDGTEDYDCTAIRLNMDRLCVHQVGSNGGGRPQLQHQHQQDEDDDGGQTDVQRQNEIRPDEDRRHVTADAAAASPCHSSAVRRISACPHVIAMALVALALRTTVVLTPHTSSCFS